MFRDSSVESIDLFLSRNREYEDVGKIAIAICLLKHEKLSKFNEEIEGNDWYRLLFTKLTDEIVNSSEYNRVNNNLLSIVTFNYDRSLEYYLNNSLYYSFSDLRNNENKMNYIKFPIYHVYGSIGALDQLQYGLIENKWQYRIDEYTKTLKTIYQERVHNEHIDMLIMSAKRVIFLGFSYLKENLSILKSNTWDKGLELYGTTIGISKKEEIDFKQMFNREIKFQKFEPIDSYSLLKEVL